MTSLLNTRFLLQGQQLIPSSEVWRLTWVPKPIHIPLIPIPCNPSGMLLEAAARKERGYLPEDADARRDLVKRIVASSSFARSNRLSEFLKYVCTLAEKGRFDDIHEQNIGSAVFKRTHDYDPGVDSIVRSHASRLRHRLKEYFEQEGQNESLILTIPRGSYIPAFEPRSTQEQASESEQATIVRNLIEEASSPAIASTEWALHLPIPSETSFETKDSETQSLKTIARLRIALIAAGIVIALLVTFLLWNPALASHPYGEDLASQNPLWKELVAGSAAKTVVVSSDSGLVMFQHLTGRPVSLASYMSGDYLKHAS